MSGGTQGKRRALVLTDGLLAEAFAKTCHGLLRGSDRFEVLAVIDRNHAGRDAGSVLDRKELGVPVFASVEAFFEADGPEAEALVIGVAFPGGFLPESARGDIATAIRRGLPVVSGLHHLLGDDPEFRNLASRHGVELVDIRRPRPTSELHFWSGDVFKAEAPRFPVLGTDCAVGKRTTCRWLLETCRRQGLAAEMIYTGQTGWMQGSPYGFVFDATPNDFVSGELEHAIVTCDREARPDLILIEGQASLRNPSGPCGSELLLSAHPAGVFLQHVPGREFFIDLKEAGCRLPAVESEIELIESYGVPVLAVTLNGEGMEPEELQGYQRKLEEAIQRPVVRPLQEGVGRLVPLLRAHLRERSTT